MIEDVVSVETPGNRDDVLRILKRTGISGVTVTKDGILVGIITRKDLLRKPSETQLSLLMTSDPYTIAPEATINEAAKIMDENKFRRLPVVENGKLKGIISIADLVSAIAQMKFTSEIKAGYAKPTFALWEGTPLPLVGRIMEISGFDAVPILNSESLLTGIISERDLIRHALIEDSVEISDLSNGTDDDEWTWESIRDQHTISFGISRVQLPDKLVKYAMIKEVIAVPQNASVSDCALKMKRSRVDQLPVINGDKKMISMLFDRELIKVLIEN